MEKNVLAKLANVIVWKVYLPFMPRGVIFWKISLHIAKGTYFVVFLTDVH